MPKLEGTLERLVAITPGDPEAWYDLAAINITLGKTNESLQDLRTSLNLSARRLQQTPKARDLLAEVRKDRRFDPLRGLPEFPKLVPPQ